MSSCHCILLRKASRKVTALYDAALAPLGISVAQYSLLRTIRHAAPVSLTDLAHRTDLDRSTIGRNTKLLERMGLVSIAQGADQREASLALTGEGERILAEAAPLWDGAQRRIEAQLGPDAVDRLRDLLEAL